jgi:hypothetical protein
MSPEAEAIKKLTLERYEYLVEDKITKYDAILKTAQKQPDEYWEKLAVAPRGTDYFNYNRG